jgi:hypothetical protein
VPDGASDTGAAIGGVIEVYPNPATIVVGTAPVSFEAQLNSDGGTRVTTSVTWTLTGPGSLSSGMGETVDYTPPATLGAVENATITASQPGATPGSAEIRLLPNVPAGATYAISGRAATNGPGNTTVDLNVSIPAGAFPSATVRVNGATIAFVGGRYQGNVGARIAPGETVSLAITVPEGEITASVVMPAAPVVTSPTAGALVPSGGLIVNWTNTSAVGHRGAAYLDPYDPAFAPDFQTPAGVLTASISGLPAGVTAFVDVVAMGETTAFVGPVMAGSLFTAESTSAASTVSFTTAP